MIAIALLQHFQSARHPHARAKVFGLDAIATSSMPAKFQDAERLNPPGSSSMSHRTNTRSRRRRQLFTAFSSNSFIRRRASSEPTGVLAQFAHPLRVGLHLLFFLLPLQNSAQFVLLVVRKIDVCCEFLKVASYCSLVS